MFKLNISIVMIQIYRLVYLSVYKYRQYLSVCICTSVAGCICVPGPAHLNHHRASCPRMPSAYMDSTHLTAPKFLARPHVPLEGKGFQHFSTVAISGMWSKAVASLRFCRGSKQDTGTILSICLFCFCLWHEIQRHILSLAVL